MRPKQLRAQGLWCISNWHRMDCINHKKIHIFGRNIVKILSNLQYNLLVEMNDFAFTNFKSKKSFKRNLELGVS